MKDLFQRIVENGEAELARLVDERFQEGISLEFKCKVDASKGEFDREDRKNLGKTLSAFSNSSGGLLIWGVECRKGEDDIDCASALMPITDIDRFFSEANNLIGEYLSPRNEQIRLHQIRQSGASNRGYLAVQVDRSERRPHRSNAPKDGHYHKRVGGNSFMMEHYDVEDAFRRTTTAQLRLRYGIMKAGGGSMAGLQYQDIKIVLSLENLSSVSATYPYLAIRNVRGAKIDKYGLDGNGDFELPIRTSIGKILYGGGVDAAVHPGQILDVTALKVQVAVGPIPAEFSRFGAVSHEIVPIEGLQIALACQIGCQNSAVYEQSVLIDEAELRSA